MDATGWVSIAGLITTLTAALVAPWLAERMRRESTRRELIVAARLDTYVDLLRVTARLAGNAGTWSALPLADLSEINTDELDRIVARIRVVASQNVYTCLDHIRHLSAQFNGRLYEAKVHHQAIRSEGNADDSTAIQQRMGLAKTADSLGAAHKELESLIRKEIAR